jgi:hypothetical protein
MALEGLTQWMSGKIETFDQNGQRGGSIVIGMRTMFML